MGSGVESRARNRRSGREPGLRQEPQRRGTSAMPAQIHNAVRAPSTRPVQDAGDESSA